MSPALINILQVLQNRWAGNHCHRGFHLGHPRNLFTSLACSGLASMRQNLQAL